MSRLVEAAAEICLGFLVAVHCFETRIDVAGTETAPRQKWRLVMAPVPRPAAGAGPYDAASSVGLGNVLWGKAAVACLRGASYCLLYGPTSAAAVRHGLEALDWLFALCSNWIQVEGFGRRVSAAMKTSCIGCPGTSDPILENISSRWGRTGAHRC